MNNLEELTKRIEANKQKEKELDSPFKTFINTYNIKAGFDKFPAFMLVFLYKKFIEKNQNYLPVSNKVLYTLLGKEFKRKRSKKLRYYLIDVKSLNNLPHDFEFNAKLWKSQNES